MKLIAVPECDGGSGSTVRMTALVKCPIVNIISLDSKVIVGSMLPHHLAPFLGSLCMRTSVISFSEDPGLAGLRMGELAVLNQV